MKRTTCSLIQRFVANYGKICTQLDIFVRYCSYLVSALSLMFEFHFITKNEGILSVVQVVQMLRAP
jgi:hypothetical protein